MSIPSEFWLPVNHSNMDTKNNINSNNRKKNNTWYRLMKNKGAMIGLLFLFILVLCAIIIPWSSDYTYYGQNLLNTNQSPTSTHWFGTDSHGRDVFIRVMHGARISLTIGMVVTVVNLIFGVIYGGIAGYIGGKLDNIMMRIVDILYVIPLALYAILFMVILGPSLKTIIIVMGSVFWLPMARMVRGQIMSIKEQEYILAAKVLGQSSTKIIMNHIIPNSFGPIIVTATFMIPEAIFIESFLSFIGLGISAPQASWGSLVADALGGFRSYPYQLFFPAITIFLTILAFNLLGDGLRNILSCQNRKLDDDD